MNEAVYDPRFLNSKGPNAFDLLCVSHLAVCAFSLLKMARSEIAKAKQ
jgi:hypothetical protein